jgi:hypothetical protein
VLDSGVILLGVLHRPRERTAAWGAQNICQSVVRPGTDDCEGARCEPARASGGVLAPDAARLGVNAKLVLAGGVVVASGCLRVCL